MDFKLTEQQEMLRDVARAFFSREFPSARLREVEERGLSDFLPVYRKMGEMGFLGIGIPEEYGGSDGTWLDLAIVNEEAGRALVPTVHISSATLAGHALLGMGSGPTREKLLPRVTRGEMVIAPTYLEDGRPSRSPELSTTAHVGGDTVRLRGKKLFVEAFDVASMLLVSAREPSGAAGFFLVSRESAGVRWKERVLQSLERVADVEFDGVPVSTDGALATDWRGWLEAVDGAKVALAAYAVGAAAAALDSALQYSNVRKQFDRPIGSFQAIQHRLVDAAMQVEQARTLVSYTAWLRQAKGSCPREVAMAKLLATRAFRQAAYASTLTYGGYGFIVDQDIQLYFRRAKQVEHQLEGPALQREIIGQAWGAGPEG